ncbi:MAG: hypothetical protein DPW16_15030 [Chloroflexi bacterium]|nr:hypothetical protein [Chloroflexota bacterium]
MWGIYINIFSDNGNSRIGIVKFLPFSIVQMFIVFSIASLFTLFVSISSGRTNVFLICLFGIFYFTWYFRKFIRAGWKAWIDLIESDLTDQAL